MGATNFSRLRAGQRAHLAVPNVEAAVHGVASVSQDRYGVIYVDLDATGGFARGFKGSDHDITDGDRFPDLGAIVDHVFPPEVRACAHPIEEREAAMAGATHCTRCNAMIPPKA